MGIYFFPFLESFLVSVGLIFVLRRITQTCGFPGGWRKGERHIHRADVSRFGGLAVIFSFLAVIFWNSQLVFSPAIWGLAIGSLAILIFGVWDDFQELDWKIQLFFQIGLAVFAFYLGIKADSLAGGAISLASYWAGLLFVIGWIVLNINSMNWLDGSDGVSGGVAFLGALTIFLLALKPEVNQPPVAIICAAFLGATLGFLMFNFHPAKIMAGSSGSMFFGFILASLSIFAGAKVATALLVMAVPIVDFVWVIGERIRAGVSIFNPDQRHLHHKLLRLGWTQREIAFFFYAITLIMAILALNTRLVGKMISILAAFALVAIFMALTNKKLTAIK